MSRARLLLSSCNDLTAARHYKQAVGERPPQYAPAPLLPLWAPKRRSASRRPADRACSSDRNVAVASHAQYVPTLTASAAVNAAVSKAAW